MKEIKIYIAGPDVFKIDSIAIGKKYTGICAEYGYKGLYPLDNVIDFNQPKQKIAQDIFVANKKLIDECDIVIANLNSFRGKEADSGTVWECGYASGLGKTVYGYINTTLSYLDQFSDDEKQMRDKSYFDNEGKIIEDFNHPINLMIACSVKKIFVGEFEDCIKSLQNKQS